MSSLTLSTATSFVRSICYSKAGGLARNTAPPPYSYEACFIADNDVTDDSMRFERHSQLHSKQRNVLGLLLLI